MIVSIFFFFLITIIQSQKFRLFYHLVSRNKEPFRLIQEKRGHCKDTDTCDTELESCQELKIALFLSHGLLLFFLVHLFCSLLFINCLLILSFLLVQNFTLSKVLLRQWHNFMASFYHWVTLHCDPISQYFQFQTFLIQCLSLAAHGS